MLLDLAFEVMEAEGDEACLALVRAGAGRVCTVELIEGPLAPDEAVALAHGLAELGQWQEARDVLAALIAAADMGMSAWGGRALGPQGAQYAAGWSLGDQGEA